MYSYFSGLRSEESIMWALIFLIPAITLRSGVHSQFVQEPWRDVRCNEEYTPSNCDLREIPLLTVEDFERCAPARLPLPFRNYLLGVSGRGLTYLGDRAALRRINILPKMMRDIRNSSLSISTLGQKMGVPIGLAPADFLKSYHADGENGTASAAAAFGTVMIVNMFSSTSLEEIARHVEGTEAKLWLQLFKGGGRDFMEDLVRRAEESGYRALVLTVDTSIYNTISCNARRDPAVAYRRSANFPDVDTSSQKFETVTFEDIRWLTSVSKLPVVVKGILNADDARRSIEYGASAILVSDHGGRQEDSTIAAVDVLPEIVDVAKAASKDVYLDSGIRDGWDVFKAIGRGAKMVFFGRPYLYGLSEDGENGVKTVLDILRREFNETMLLAGLTNPAQITPEYISPARPSSSSTCPPSLGLDDGPITGIFSR